MGATFEYGLIYVATGTQTSFYGQRLLAEWAPEPECPSKKLPRSDTRFFYAFERGRAVPPHRKKRALGSHLSSSELGATGLELSGSTRGKICSREPAAPRFFEKSIPSESAIHLMEGGPEEVFLGPISTKICRPKAEKLVSRGWGGR